MHKLLFDEFPEVSAKMWKQKIQFDLKGAEYSTLLSKAAEGIDIRPFYHPDDAIPVHAGLKKSGSWKTGQRIYAGNEEMAAKKAIHAIDRGAESLWFTVPSEDTDLSALLGQLPATGVSLHIQPLFLSPDFTRKSQEQLSGFSKVYLHNDTIGNLARSGNWFYTFEKDRDLFLQTIGSGEKLSSVITTDLSLYQNAGANIVQQLAYAMAHINEYLNLPETTTALDGRTVVFKTAIGSDYFFEIAKLRALRILWHTLSRQYGIKTECHILAFPTRRNKTLYDYNVNMLRTTTECMSAILGGADTICNLPYDSIYHKDNEFAERIARNQLLILKNESYFDKVSNPADGAYYIEDITNRISEKALDIFKQIEAGGGFLQQLKDHTIQKKIKESARTEQQLFDEGQHVLIGTNTYRNPDDRMTGALELFPFIKTRPRKTLIEPVTERRLAEKTEQERLAREQKSND